MPLITDWLMVAITAVYVCATIAIWIANKKSAEMTETQLKESQRQFSESQRLSVLPFLSASIGESVYPNREELPIPDMFLDLCPVVDSEKTAWINAGVTVSNIGTGLAVAGAFSLVRFRSVPGSAKEITMLFLAMGTGLLTGMGHIGFGFVFAVIMSIVMMLYNHLDFGAQKNALRYKTIRITIPEDLDYSNVFDEVLKKYTDNYEMVRVKTLNMGSMFRISYNLTMKKDACEKEMLDELRCRNGNLEISISKQETTVTEL